VQKVGKRTDNIHHYHKRLERAIRHLKNHPEITEENKAQILSFLERITAEGLSLARQVSYVQWLTTIAAALPPGRNFTDTTQADVQRIVAGFNNRDWTDSTRQNHRQAIKRFWRWLRKCPEGEDPPETEWFKAGKGKGCKILPEQLLTREEARKIITAAEHPRDKAFISILDEAGPRPEELLSTRIRNIQFDQYGAVLIVGGKTGMRRLRLIRSAPTVALWLDNHPQRDNRNAPIWINIGSTRHGGAFDYEGARKLLRVLGPKAGINKRLYPYLFRHSTATYLANYLTEAQMCQFFGWIQGSRMPAYYVHLSGRDVDNRMLELHGLKPKQDELKGEIQACPRCEFNNSAISKFCNRCGSPMTLQIGLDAERRINNGQEALEILLKDEAVRTLLAQKMQELGLVEKLAQTQIQAVTLPHSSTKSR
jgi:site-specific recombinase XerD